MSKQDANGVRTAADLERKYNFETLKKAIEQNEKGLTKTNKELEDFIEELGNIGEQLDGQIITWYGNGEPNLSNYPANEWSDEEYNKHVEDLYYDMDGGYPYRFVLDGTTYKWERLSDDDLSNVLAIASHAKDTADKKRRVFVTTPTPPYDVGDLWLKTITQKNIYGQNVNQTVLYRCSAAKERGETYAESDFVSATDYATNNNFETVEHKAEEAAGTATNFIKIDTSDGVIIGKQSDLGGNLLLKSGNSPGLYIRNGKDVLAYFDENSISLGSLNTAAVIALCGAGTISGVVDKGQYGDSTALVIKPNGIDGCIDLKSGISRLFIDSSYIQMSVKSGALYRGLQLDTTDGGAWIQNMDVSGAVISNSYIDDSCSVDSSTHKHSKLDNDSYEVLLTGAFLRPTSNGAVSLGGSSYKWNSFYVNDIIASNSIKVGGTNVSLSGHNHSGETIKPSTLYVTGGASVSEAANVRMVASGTNKGQICYAGGSSKRFKHDIHPLSQEHIEKFHRLYDVEVKRWIYNDDYLIKGDNAIGKELYGLIAEDVAEAIPEAVSYDGDGNVTNYNDRRLLNAMLVLIQEQKQQIDALEKRIERLEQMLAK